MLPLVHVQFHSAVMIPALQWFRAMGAILAMQIFSLEVSLVMAEGQLLFVTKNEIILQKSLCGLSGHTGFCICVEKYIP